MTQNIENNKPLKNKEIKPKVDPIPEIPPNLVPEKIRPDATPEIIPNPLPQIKVPESY